MKIVYNRILPVEGYKCIMLFGVLFARKGARIDQQTLTHERIHAQQMIETLVIGFYLWYILEWLVRLAFTRNAHDAYRRVAFEREAYAHEDDKTYLEERKRFNWFNILTHKN